MRLGGWATGFVLAAVLDCASCETFQVGNAVGMHNMDHKEHHLHREIMLKAANSAGTRPKISLSGTSLRAHSPGFV